MSKSEKEKAYMREYMRKRRADRRANGSSSNAVKSETMTPVKNGTVRTVNKLQEILPWVVLGIVVIGIAIFPILVVRYSAMIDDTKEKKN